MTSAKTVGRTMGVLLLVQAVLGSTVNFGLLSSITGPPGFLINAAASPTRMSLAALLLIAAGFVSIALSTNAWPVIRQYSPRAALAWVALSGAGLALAAVEAGTIMSMLSISQEYTNSTGPETRQFEIAGTVVRYARYWAHYTNLLIGSGTLLLVYTTLFRFSLVPRILAGVGAAAVLLQMTTLTMPFFGNRINFYLLAPMGLCHLALAIWLLAKGFREEVDAEPVERTTPSR
jgi:Domain of unknown function (DUF4386)